MVVSRPMPLKLVSFGVTQGRRPWDEAMGEVKSFSRGWRRQDVPGGTSDHGILACEAAVRVQTGFDVGRLCSGQ